ncbi:hypothetical protein L2227_05775 [Wolbachia endosymbiont of Delia radicum]|nr:MULTISPECIES: hypothetical protein [unclassified Wolbachia]UJQ20671.1 hypothetical protein L2227_05775 [Wolbachia endosymbiont of Delia radicum]
MNDLMQKMLQQFQLYLSRWKMFFVGYKTWKMSYSGISALLLQGSSKSTCQNLLMAQRHHSHKLLFLCWLMLAPPPMKGEQSVDNPLGIYSLII